MFGIFKRKDKAKTETGTTAPSQPVVSMNEAPVVNAIKLYTIALDQSCKMARDLLSERNLKYEEIDATGNGSLISWLRKETGEVTFPRVFVYGKHIGGYEQLRSF